MNCLNRLGMIGATLTRLRRSGFLAGALLLIAAAFFTPPASAAAPVNDSLAGATTVSSLPYSNTQSTVDATLEVGEPQPCGSIGATVWYVFTPSAEVVVKVTTAAYFDTVLAVYSGNSLPFLNLVECNDDTAAVNSAVQFVASPGVSYSIQVGGYEGSAGDVTVDMAVGIPPSNDSFAGAQALSEPLPALDSRNTIVATTEEGEPEPPCAYIGRTVWYRFAPGQNGLYRVSTQGSDFDTVLAVYTGSAIESLSQVVCNDDESASALVSEALFPGAAGKTYSIQVGGYQGDSGQLSVSLHAETDVSDLDGDGYGAAAETYIGTGSNDPCGYDGWPSNVYDGGASMNKLDVQDLTSFLAPVRRLGSSPPALAYSPRWDLVPGSTPPFSSFINTLDMTALIAGDSGFPPMFSGQRALGQTCPQPP